MFDIIFYLIGKSRCFFPVGSPFSILYGFFPQDFLLHRNVCGCHGSGLNRISISICYIWLKWDIYIYIHIQPSDYLGIHAYIPVYTYRVCGVFASGTATSSYVSHCMVYSFATSYHLLRHEPQGPRYHVQL